MRLSMRDSKIDSALKYIHESRTVELFSVPSDLDSITNTEWDLSVWTLLCTDECLDNLCRCNDTSQVSRLVLSNADKITDKGLQTVAHKMPTLEDLSFENAYRITGNGLKEIVTNCLRLRCLNLSGCLGISSLSFALLGRHASHTVQLNVSRCNQITEWAFIKIFQGCIHLEDLDLSHCSQITDHAIKVLGECCLGLKRLNINECVQVSDIGVVSLKASKSLELINLSRKNLSSRITDVSLMALAEGCNNLLSISLCGCEMITDVGISWLANGCKKLTQLNIANCSKVSNAGLRYIGEECHQLRKVVLNNVKKISDVGIRFLANGCNKLEHLHVSGLYLLSDGVHREFRLEGIQSLSASLSSMSIRSLNLQGCFQISSVSLKTIASMMNLEFLNLSGCTLLTCEGMVKIAKSCKYLSHLSLARCGDCITNDMIHRISPNLLSLKSLDLSYCEKVGKLALKGLSSCTSLISLNLSGCISIVNEGILALGEGRFKHGIQELNLSKCYRIDDASIAWIVDSFQVQNEDAGTVSLTTLVLTGTKVSTRAAQAVRDRFLYSTLKVNENFFGFLALSRSNDRKIIRHYSRKVTAAIKIQALIRGKKWSHITHQLKERSIMNIGATKIESGCRRYLSRQTLRRLRNERWTQIIMAQRLQCFTRCYLAKARVHRLKYQLWKKIAPSAAVKIQKIFRGWKGYMISARVKKERYKLIQLQITSCTKIQCISRIYLSKKKRLSLLERKLTRNKVASKACISIQSRYRQKLANRIFTSLKTEKTKIQRIQRLAAIRVQKLMKRFLFKLCIERKIENQRWKRYNAVMIQTWYRCILSKNELNKRKAINLQIQITNSAIIIQCFARKILSISQLALLSRERAAIELAKEHSALIISCLWRQFVARQECNKRRKSREVQMRTIARVQAISATKLAALCRGRKGRLIARKVRHDKSRRWKEIWSDEHRCCFYYNRVTGETRWKKPQELLDLEPRPSCSNCCVYVAQIECKVCDEFFCVSCFQSIHYGGKRRCHPFRALYNFYDKRICYEIDEFPSIWPARFERHR